MKKAPLVRIDRKVHPFELAILAQLVILHVLLDRYGFVLEPSAILFTMARVGPGVALAVGVGIVLRAAYSWVTGRGPAYLRALKGWRWWLLTLRIVFFATLVVHVYGYLKLVIPIFHPRIFDQTFWELDRWLMFGLSPNVFFLHAFSNPTVLRVIDGTYGLVFRCTLITSIGFFFTFRNDRLRIAYATGMSTMWLVGAWLYLALPALGPCYVFPEIWAPFAEFFPNTLTMQGMLMQNYQLVEEMRRGVMSSNLNIMAGIAAMPSLHVASQLFVALWARRLTRGLGNFLLVTVLLLTLGSVITGWHYLIDALVGGLLAWGCYAFSLRLYGLQRFRSRSTS